MNVLKGLGVCLVLAATTFTMTHLTRVRHAALAIAVGVATCATLGFLASVRRLRWDRRMAGERGRRRGRAAARGVRTR